jgi:2-hydroxychromene-2-carboxylate isomerase
MIKFYFDFSSPYGYLASTQIEALAAKHRVVVDWHPILLGAVFKQTGGAPLTQIPMKGAYSIHDFHRSAAFYGVPFNMPSTFPISGVAAARAALWARQQSMTHCARLTHALFKALYVDSADISQAEVVVAVAQASGFDGAALTHALQLQDLKDALKAEVEEALANQVFGSPFFVIEGESFWGADRLPQIDWWLAKSKKQVM